MALPLVNQSVAPAGQVSAMQAAYPSFLKQVERAELEPRRATLQINMLTITPLPWPSLCRRN